MILLSSPTDVTEGSNMLLVRVDELGWTERSVGTESLGVLDSSYASYSLSIDYFYYADFVGRFRCQKWAGPGNLWFL